MACMTLFWLGAVRYTQFQHGEATREASVQLLGIQTPSSRIHIENPEGVSGLMVEVLGLTVSGFGLRVWGLGSRA